MLPDYRFKIILKEMELLQGRFDKYDQLINSNRNIFKVLFLTILAYSIEREQPLWCLAISVIAIIFYFFEIIWRVKYWHKYVNRYRYIRHSLNFEKSIENLSLYDLTNHYGPNPSKFKMLLSCLKNYEAIIFFCFWILLSIVAYFCIDFFVVSSII